jgi:hypothetical protein
MIDIETTYPARDKQLRAAAVSNGAQYCPPIGVQSWV